MDQREASRTPVVHTTGRIPGKVKKGHVIEHVHPRITKSTVIQVSQAHEDHGDPSDQVKINEELDEYIYYSLYPRVDSQIFSDQSKHSSE